MVSLGVDAADGDPESPLGVTRGRIPRSRARSSARSECRRCFVQEGGYDLETLGPLVLEVLSGVESAG